MTSDIFCSPNSKSSIDTEYTNDDSFNEKTKEDLLEDIAQLEHVNSKMQKHLATSQKEAEEAIDSLHQQIRTLQLDRDEKERSNAFLNKRLMFLTEYKVETGTQTSPDDQLTKSQSRRRVTNRSVDSETSDATVGYAAENGDTALTCTGEKRHTILILGDSHGRHISQLLTDDLGPHFSVSGMLKPHASLVQVTANISDLARGFSKSDFIAVLVGDTHVDVVTDLWDLLAATCSTNLILGLVPTRVDTKEADQPTLVLGNNSTRSADGSAYLIPVRRDRPGSLGRGAKKELSSKMADIILRVLGERSRPGSGLQ